MSNASYDGDEKGLDLSWSSDLKDVEYATDPEEDQGDVSFDFLPDDVDPRDLSETQRNILATAAIRDPSSIKELSDMVDSTPEWCCRTLRDNAPDLYDEVRMAPNEVAEDANPIPEPGTTDDQDDEPDEFVPVEEHEQQRRVDDAILQCETIEEIHPGTPEARTAREIRRTLEEEER